MAYETWNPPFEVGARVKVVGQRKYCIEKLVGLVGTVKTNYSNSIAVLLDTITNERSSYGYFYFKPSELVAVEENDNEITEEKNMNAITNYLNIARVTYVNDRKSPVCQYANFDPDLKEGDYCVVVNEVGQFMVAKVFEIEDERDNEMFREVVTKIDATAWEDRLDARAKAADLKAKMEARAKQLQDIALYQMLAKDDPEMAELLQEYQGLSKV